MSTDTRTARTAALTMNRRGASAALTTVVCLLAMLLWPDLRPWTAIALTMAGLWWLKEADEAALRRHGLPGHRD